ncbi:MerR family transcriptional regulator [Nocardia sp. NPDC049149]|uniref:MerR family transcriptional regulator n=1 Tax=Nocardia sp. NPDC049149 TaxID=3364315 RepID=UPI003715931C
MPFSIGEVARRFGVAVSVLRWWEKQGLLMPSGRESGRRRYDEADVRRIALIQLLQETALMSLEEIRTVLNGEDHSGGWRQVVQTRLDACEEQQLRLQAAQAYLSHALACQRDDLVDGCPYLSEEIDNYLESIGDRSGDQAQKAQHRPRRRSETLNKLSADRWKEGTKSS